MHSIHILLVEDNEGDIILTTEALNESGFNHTLSVTRDGWEAIQYLYKDGDYTEAVRPDLILLDINLPKLNGHEVLSRVKQNPALKEIPTIILSTSSDERDIKKSYRNYSNCYIVKPGDIQSFTDVIESIEIFWLKVAELPNNADKLR
ncbi:MAG: response regulator [Balneolaceae bacterium]|nr:MAG: response regulator [Balneolaceae bacterium]